MATQIFFIITPIWGRFPCWLIFFSWVETTNQVELFHPTSKWFLGPLRHDTLGIHSWDFWVSNHRSRRQKLWGPGVVQSYAIRPSEQLKDLHLVKLAGDRKHDRFPPKWWFSEGNLGEILFHLARYIYIYTYVHNDMRIIYLTVCKLHSIYA